MKYSLKNEAGEITPKFKSKQAYKDYLVHLRETNELDWSAGCTFATRQPNRDVYTLIETKTGNEVKI